jgi:hypothetical protein
LILYVGSGITCRQKIGDRPSPEDLGRARPSLGSS